MIRSHRKQISIKRLVFAIPLNVKSYTPFHMINIMSVNIIFYRFLCVGS